MRHHPWTTLGWVVAALLLVATGDALAKKPVVKKEYSGTVNLNTATAAQLDQLPGVGEKAARRIVEHRSKTPFAKPEDLSRVKGFGPKKLKVLRPLISVSGPTTLKVKSGAGSADTENSAQGRAPPTHR